VNVAFYGAPQFGFFALPGLITLGVDAMVLEAMLDIGLRLEPCAIGITAAFVTNIADDDKGGGGSALRAGLSANFDVGGGFRLIPGLIYTQYLKGAGGVDVDFQTLALGVTFVLNF